MSNKSIGQFFSGPLVSDLLVSAADIQSSESINAIDPMVGKADMLEALRRAGAKPENLFGIDIDGSAIAGATTAIPGHNLLATDAFSSEATDVYRAREWDLVITNPPYVRYQKLSAMYGDDPVDTVRGLLGKVIDALDDNGAKRHYLNAARSYSGLADLAVPCWILCAYLVKPGGKLAMVLPDSWLKREYSAAIHEILAANFTVERVIIDESRSWFADAQVKTSLLVATKNQHWATQMTQKDVRHVGLTKHAANSESLVGNLSYSGTIGTDAFKSVCVNEARFADESVWVRDEPLYAWDIRMEGVQEHANSGATLRDWHISVGQGLRTGANGFFYFSLSENGRASNAIWSEIVGNEPVDPNELPLIPALRYQDEITGGCLIDNRRPAHLLLRIIEPINFDDAVENGGAYNALARYIAYCETHDVVQNGRKQRIPQLSAVRTNGPTSETCESDRYWYMLPELKDRHMPDLVIPRINGGPVRAYLLPEGQGGVVDANFSTLWVDSRDRADAYAALALLNSTYVRLGLETTCNVLGGGALKCEAVSIRKMALPAPSSELRKRLSDLGMQIAKSNRPSDTDKAQDEIDLAIAQAMMSAENVSDTITKWRDELDLRLKIRRE